MLIGVAHTLWASSRYGDRDGRLRICVDHGASKRYSFIHFQIVCCFSQGFGVVFRLPDHYITTEAQEPTDYISVVAVINIQLLVSVITLLSADITLVVSDTDLVINFLDSHPIFFREEPILIVVINF